MSIKNEKDIINKLSQLKEGVVFDIKAKEHIHSRIRARMIASGMMDRKGVDIREFLPLVWKLTYVVALLFVCVVGVGSIAEGATPGTLLYTFKRTVNDPAIYLGFEATGGANDSYHAFMLERRFSEARILLSKPAVDSNTLFKKVIANAVYHAEKLETTDNSKAVLKGVIVQNVDVAKALVATNDTLNDSEKISSEKLALVTGGYSLPKDRSGVTVSKDIPRVLSMGGDAVVEKNSSTQDNNIEKNNLLHGATMAPMATVQANEVLVEIPGIDFSAELLGDVNETRVLNLKIKAHNTYIENNRLTYKNKCLLDARMDKLDFGDPIGCEDTILDVTLKPDETLEWTYSLNIGDTLDPGDYEMIIKFGNFLEKTIPVSLK